MLTGNSSHQRTLNFVLLVGLPLTVNWGQARLPHIAMFERKETAGMGCHLLVLTICELVNAGTAAELCRGLATSRREQQEVVVSRLFSQLPLPTHNGRRRLASVPSPSLRAIHRLGSWFYGRWFSVLLLSPLYVMRLNRWRYARV